MTSLTGFPVTRLTTYTIHALPDENHTITIKQYEEVAQADFLKIVHTHLIVRYLGFLSAPLHDESTYNKRQAYVQASAKTRTVLPDPHSSTDLPVANAATRR